LSQSNWLVSIKEAEPEELRLICFHHAGGAASFFRGWRTALPDDVSMSALQLPGREERQEEPYDTNMASVLDRLEKALQPLTARPYVLFGHSLGARIAFELAVRLERANLPSPRLLWLSATPSPDCQRVVKTYDLPDEAFIESIKAYSGTPKDVLEDTELLRWFLPRLRADTRLLERYALTQGAPVSTPLVFSYGSEDTVCDAAEAKLWERQTRGWFTARRFNGGHFYLRYHHRAILRAIVDLAFRPERPSTERRERRGHTTKENEAL
jgi:medium-chain acyl-[acyl-carrier-protein] hydrolase